MNRQVKKETMRILEKSELPYVIFAGLFLMLMIWWWKIKLFCYNNYDMVFLVMYLLFLLILIVIFAYV